MLKGREGCRLLARGNFLANFVLRMCALDTLSVFVSIPLGDQWSVLEGELGMRTETAATAACGAVASRDGGFLLLRAPSRITSLTSINFTYTKRK